ncbi:GntR family transcriptional regulator [Flexibacterium corallicola]|uniref:GntR family transcriptional regulator n=1 Tax=Flexibacterium corallicola TaxID=3037259 RepID=UPI00286F8056|nr:GntR family transcriptional regulator [Pseudovibrio sp. M1P-2-3]
MLSNTPCSIDYTRLIGADVDLEQKFGLNLKKQPKLRKSDTVYFSLKRQVVMGVIPPGQSLGEQQLAFEFNCAQGTIREALIRLEQIGFVIRHDYKGTQVSELILPEIRQMVAIRKQLEMMATGVIASRLNDDAYELLKKVIEVMHETAQEGDTYTCSDYDRFFHRVLFAASGYNGLAPILDRCNLHIHRFSFGTRERPLDPQEILELHNDLLEVCRKGSPEQASKAAFDHIEVLIDKWDPDLGRLAPTEPLQLNESA